LKAGFVSVVVLRDRVAGMLTLAHCSEAAIAEAQATAHALHPQPELLRTGTTYGDFRGT
jgi:hypothetical protein